MRFNSAIIGSICAYLCLGVGAGAETNLHLSESAGAFAASPQKAWYDVAKKFYAKIYDTYPKNYPKEGLACFVFESESQAWLNANPKAAGQANLVALNAGRALLKSLKTHSSGEDWGQYLKGWEDFSEQYCDTLFLAKIFKSRKVACLKRVEDIKSKIKACQEKADGAKKPVVPEPNKPPIVIEPAVKDRLHSADELLTYLKQPNFPPEVKKLFDRGIAVYRDANSELAKTRKANFGAMFAGRPNDWITKTFAQEERDIIETLKKIDAPATWTIAEINKAFDRIRSPEANTSIPQITMVKGFNVTQFPDVPLGHGGILQLASQFNYLESQSTLKTPVSQYITDKTQGPGGSVEAAAAALHRTAAEEANNLPHSLHRILPPNHQKYYQNGYLMLRRVEGGKLAQIKSDLESKIAQMEILPQWVTYEASGAVQLQVLSAAPSYQGADAPAHNSEGGQICDLLVSAQYEALAKLAVIMNVMMKKDIPVHLTMVGQGVFKNPPEVMKSSLERVAIVIRGYPHVRVFIHAYGQDAQKKILEASKTSTESYTLEEMSADEFAGAPADLGLRPGVRHAVVAKPGTMKIWDAFKSLSKKLKNGFMGITKTKDYIVARSKGDNNVVYMQDGLSWNTRNKQGISLSCNILTGEVRLNNTIVADQNVDEDQITLIKKLDDIDLIQENLNESAGKLFVALSGDGKVDLDVKNVGKLFYHAPIGTKYDIQGKILTLTEQNYSQDMNDKLDTLTFTDDQGQIIRLLFHSWSKVHPFVKTKISLN